MSDPTTPLDIRTGLTCADGTSFPLRWGFPAPVAPMSFGAGVADVLLWLLNFEVFGYATHVLIHRRTFCGVRLPLYEWVHQPHHRYRQPTAFCAQAISECSNGRLCLRLLPRL